MTSVAGLALSLACLTCLTTIPSANAQEHGKRTAKRKTSDKNRDMETLHELVRQSRAELQLLRKQAGLQAVDSEGRGEHGKGRREGRGEHAEGRRERRGEHGEGHREGRGEHGKRRGESGREEEGGKRLGKNESWNKTRKGAHLVLAYDAASQSFKGTVHNTTSKTLSAVRVEVHLSNGVELGPTKRTDLKPGKKIAVELSAANQKFNWWTTHPEHGSEEGHGPEHERGTRGELGKRDENRPEDPTLRPLYNELLLLRHEIKMLARDLRNRDR